MNKIDIPRSSCVKYLKLHLDNKLTWREHIKKCKQTDLRIEELYWLLGRESKISLENKLLLYKGVIRPV